MKILHVVPVMHVVPPAKYGGIEQVVAELALYQAQHGHQVSILCAAGSRSEHSNITIVDAAPYPTYDRLHENRSWEIKEFQRVIALQKEYDLIHFHYEPYIASYEEGGVEKNFFSELITPTVITFHNHTYIDQHIEYYKKHISLTIFPTVFLSNSHRAPLSFFQRSFVVGNGIPVERFDYKDTSGNYLLFVGRITPTKGIKQAIEVALATQTQLLIAAKIDSSDKEYYETEIKKYIDGEKIIYLGEVGFEKKNELYGGALSTLCPVQWEEPFGLVMAESIACGTPVIALNKGSVPEVVSDGKTGYVCNSVSEMIEAVGKIKSIKRSDCRTDAEQRFTVGVMGKKYDEVYKTALALTWPLSS